MSKYNALWQHVAENCKDTLTLSFAEIQRIVGVPIDHAFLQYKKELVGYGCQVGKISLKQQTVIFHKID